MISSVKKINLDGQLDNYKMTLSDGKIWYVPLVEANTDYQNIIKWVAEVDENGVSKGNTIEEAD